MEIEVRQDNGMYANAKVKVVTPEIPSVVYKNGWKPDETVSYEKCRALRTKPTGNSIKQETPNFNQGDTVEAYVKLPDNQVHCWAKATIRDIKSGFVVVDGTDELQFTDIVPVDDCRTLDATFTLFSRK